MVNKLPPSLSKDDVRDILNKHFPTNGQNSQNPTGFQTKECGLEVENAGCIHLDRPLVDELLRVLIHQVGDNRQCGCGKNPIINDRTSQDAFSMYKKIEGLLNG